MKSSKQSFLIFVLELMTSDMSDPNHQRQNQNNCCPEEYYAVYNITFEVVNSSLHDFNDNNTVYETVVVRVASPIEVFFTPCLITLGISGNMLALYVFFSSKLRHQSTSQYLSALAISDSLFLGELFPPWLSTMDINSIFHRGAFCKGFVYISYVTCCLSSWLVIAFTVERFIAVQYPLQRPSVCTVRRARYIIVALTLGSMVVNLPVIHFAGSENQVCHIDKEKLEQAAKFNWVDTTVTFTIPLILIIFFNTWIAAVVYKLERDRIKLTQEEVRAAATMSQHKPRDSRSDFIYLRSQRRITNMLLIVSTIFVLFNCPAYTLRICGYAYDMDAGDVDDKWLTAQKVATMMFNANFGVNFFLYCLTGQNFRRALVQSVPCCRWLARAFNALFHRTPANNGRACSVTSAASTGTDATCTELSFARAAGRRVRRRSDQYIMRWTFDNSRHRRGVAVSGTSESIAMREIVPQPGPSRTITEQPKRSGTPHSLAVRKLAVVEPRCPVVESRRFSADRRSSSVESGRIAVEPRRASVAPGPSSMEPRLPDIESRPSTFELSRTPTESRRLAVDFRRSAVDSSPSAIDVVHPNIEISRPGPSRLSVVGNRSSSCLRRLLRLFRRNGARRRREQAYLYD